MQKKLVVITTLMFLPLQMMFAASADSTEPGIAEHDAEERTASICRDHSVIEKTAIEKTKQFDVYKITIGRDRESLCHFVEVKKQGQVIYRDQEIGSHFYFGANVDKKDSPFRRLLPGGHLNFILSKWTGGAHCCFSLQIFDLENGFSKVADIEGGSSVPTFKDIDGDGSLEIEVEDDFLVYRFSSFVSSAIGHVVLKYRDGQYVVASEIMRKAPISIGSLIRKITSWQKTLKKISESEWSPEFPQELPRPFMQAITDLTFSGNKKTALKLIELVWPKDRPGKDAFVKAYEEALRESRFYPEFEKQLH